MSLILFYFRGALSFSWQRWAVILGLAGALLLGGCRSGPTTVPSPAASHTPASSQEPAASTLTPTSFQPSPTVVALAAEVNGAGIPRSNLEAELARYQAASGGELSEDERQQVLDDLINQALLAQAAAEEGFAPGEAEIQARIDQLVEQLGSQEALTKWMADYGYTEKDFRQALAQGMAAAWMRDRIIAAVPETAEQVHARQILVDTREEAEQVLARLNAGSNFAGLAAEYDPVAEGELGWFPRGYLLYPEVEEAAFRLAEGQHSEIIQTSNGFHIILVIERDSERPLTADARLLLQEQALQEWLEQKRSESTITIEQVNP